MKNKSTWKILLLNVAVLSLHPTRSLEVGGRIIFPDEVLHYITQDGVATLKFSQVDHPGDACVTKEGDQGECKPLHQCPELKDFLMSGEGFRNKKTVDYLRSRMCRLFSKDAHVCCVNNPDQPAVPPSDLTVPKPSATALSECGITSISKIRGGKKFVHGTHPWLVGVGYPAPENGFVVKCGGTLITQRHVLTAAHCFQTKKMKREFEITHVILGEHKLSTNDEREMPIVRRIASVIEREYNATTRYNDIAIIVMDQEVQFSTYIQPACLPPPDLAKKFDILNEKLFVVGWGRAHFLELENMDEPLEVALSFVPLTECERAYKADPNIIIDETRICLGDADNNACLGDSGGPVIHSDEDGLFRHFVVGVVAFGYGCGSSTFPGVYTYVPAYFNWIMENVKN